jgi:hypothetical protein
MYFFFFLMAMMFGQSTEQDSSDVSSSGSDMRQELGHSFAVEGSDAFWTEVRQYTNLGNLSQLDVVMHFWTEVGLRYELGHSF